MDRTIAPSLDADPQQLRLMYQALVEQIPAVLYINGPSNEADTLYVSPQTNDILGLPQEGWYDETWTGHVHPDDIDSVSENYSAFLRSAEVGVDEYRFIRPDGQTIWIHDRVTIIRDETGAPTLVQGVMFDVTEQRRAEQVLAEQAEMLARIENIGRRFTDLLLQGVHLRDILGTLAEIVGNPVVFEDAAHQLIGHARAGVSTHALMDAWQGHARTEHPTESTADGDDQTGCAWQAVRLRDEEWGRLHVLAVAHPVDEVDRLAVDRAAAAIGIWLLTHRESGSLADAARSEALADVWQGRTTSSAEVLARFRALGADLDRSGVAAIAVECVELGQRVGPMANAQARQRTTERLLAALRAALAEATVPGVTAAVGEICLGVIGVGSEGQARLSTDKIAERVLARLAESDPELTVVVGLSRAGQIEDLRRCLTDAADASGYGSRVSGHSAIHHADDLGLRSLLAQLGAGPDLSRFVEAELGPLLAHDADHGSDLVGTLTAYLASGCQKAAAARTLHIQRRTLYYRLDRIEAILKRRIEDPSTRLRLEVAVHGLDVLHERRT